MSLYHLYSTLLTHEFIWLLLSHTTQSIPIQNYHQLNTSLNITFNNTNNTFIFSTVESSTYSPTEYITTLFTDANVGISKELLYISGVVFILIIISLLIYCIFRCIKHRKQKELSKKPVNHMDDIDEDTKKINAFNVTITQNEFALHNTQNAYTINRLASSSLNSQVELNKLNNRMNSTSTNNTAQTVGSIMSNSTTQNKPKPITNSMLPEIQTEPTTNNTLEFVNNTPVGVGDQRNRTGTIQYTAQPSEQKIQTMLEPIDTPIVEDTEYTPHNRNVTTDTNMSNQTVKYMPENEVNDSENDESIVSETDETNSNNVPAPMQPPSPKQIAVVDTLTAMVQQSYKKSNAAAM